MTGGRVSRHRWNYCRTHAQSFTTECIGCRLAREAAAKEASAMVDSHTHRCSNPTCTKRVPCTGRPVANGDCPPVCEFEMDAMNAGRDTLEWLCDDCAAQCEEDERRDRLAEDGPPDADHELGNTSLDSYDRAWEQKKALR